MQPYSPGVDRQAVRDRPGYPLALEIISRLRFAISLSVVVIIALDSVTFHREVVTFSVAELMLRHD